MTPTLATVDVAHRPYDPRQVSFDMADLLENVRATMVTISNLKPEVIKGSYIKQVGVQRRVY